MSPRRRQVTPSLTFERSNCPVSRCRSPRNQDPVRAVEGDGIRSNSRPADGVLRGGEVDLHAVARVAEIFLRSVSVPMRFPCTMLSVPPSTSPRITTPSCLLAEIGFPPPTAVSTRCRVLRGSVRGADDRAHADTLRPLPRARCRSSPCRCNSPVPRSLSDRFLRRSRHRPRGCPYDVASSAVVCRRFCCRMR